MTCSKFFLTPVDSFWDLKKPLNSIHLVDKYWGDKEDRAGPPSLQQPHTATRKPLHPWQPCLIVICLFLITSSDGELTFYNGRPFSFAITLIVQHSILYWTRSGLSIAFIGQTWFCCQSPGSLLPPLLMAQWDIPSSSQLFISGHAPWNWDCGWGLCIAAGWRKARQGSENRKEVNSEQLTNPWYLETTCSSHFGGV